MSNVIQLRPRQDDTLQIMAALEKIMEDFLYDAWMRTVRDIMREGGPRV